MKFKRKYNVDLVGNLGCFNDNTNYKQVYNDAVIEYLDNRYGEKWRRFLAKNGHVLSSQP